MKYYSLSQKELPDCPFSGFGGIRKSHHESYTLKLPVPIGFRVETGVFYWRGNFSPHHGCSSFDAWQILNQYPPSYGISMLFLSCSLSQRRHLLFGGSSTPRNWYASRLPYYWVDSVDLVVVTSFLIFEIRRG